MKLNFPKIKLSKIQLIVVIIIGAIFILVGTGLLGYKLGSSGKRPVVINNTITNEENKEVKPCFRRKIDGFCLEKEEGTNFYPVAVIVENMVEAWPLAGVDKANLVIEAPVEAGIPRLLAIYTNDKAIPEIGPVRSARLYYIDWAEEFGALYLHVGGSPEALAKIKNYNIFDLNQYFQDKYFRRAENRSAPHNVYTSSDLIKKALLAEELNEVAYESWSYKDDAKPDDRPSEVKDIVVDFSKPIYRVTWRYNRETNDYLRYQGENVQKMADGSDIRVKNIAIQIAQVQIVDDIGRRKILTVGRGKAIVFRDGKVIEGEWKKESRGARTKFYDAEGKEIEFNGGTTWIEVVPDAKAVTYK